MDLTTCIKENGRAGAMAAPPPLALTKRSPGEEFICFDETQLKVTDTGRERPGGVPSLVRDLRAAAGAADRQRLVRGTLYTIGFEWLGYGTMLPSSEGFAPRTVFTSYANPEWTERYFAERHYLIDPRLKESAHTCLPLAWDVEDLERSLGKAGWTNEGRRFIEDMLGSGIRSGICLALGSPANASELTFISLLSRAQSRQWIVDGIFGQAVTLGLCVHEFITQYARITTPAQPSDKRALSPLQQEILQCLSRGLSDKQIAYCLNLSSYNVDYHLRQMRRRFAVRNRVQLVNAAMAALPQAPSQSRSPDARLEGLLV
ncbi:LuxR family transcriptional regulator [Pandoraea sp.]|uniref:helix-turn-helix transcriptional regulator n=1 Tax=Pandoraea sp. TaxID=1883445 RepID=UPI0025E11993|nr:LuxR family transcriptional regulator [Pandoraea sp.]